MGRPFSSQRQFTAFGEFVLTLAQTKGIKLDNLTDIVPKTRLYEALRASVSGKRAAPKLSYEELSDIATELKADEQETLRLILLGLLQHAPPELASCTIAAITNTIALARRLGAASPELDLSGTALTLPDELPRKRRRPPGRR